MPNTCARCSQTFAQWFLYKMHVELCTMEPLIKKLGSIMARYTKEQKAAIVAKGEMRLGQHHFIGG